MIVLFFRWLSLLFRFFIFWFSFACLTPKKCFAMFANGKNAEIILVGFTFFDPFFKTVSQTKFSFFCLQFFFSFDQFLRIFFLLFYIIRICWIVLKVFYCLEFCFWNVYCCWRSEKQIHCQKWGNPQNTVYVGFFLTNKIASLMFSKRVLCVFFSSECLKQVLWTFDSENMSRFVF